MKKIFFLIGIMAISFTAYSQVTTEELELVKSILHSERKVFFVQNMNLTTAEYDRFWPIFNNYQQEVSKVQASAISDYKRMVNEGSNLSDEELEVINKEYFKRHKKLISLQEKYYRVIKKEFNTGAATRFLQIDRFVDATIRASLFSDIPLVKGEY